MKNLIVLAGVICLFLMLPACAPAPEPEPEAAPEPTVDAQTEEIIKVMDQWNNEVWQQGKLELVPELLGPTYVRHELEGTRTWTPEEYAKHIAATRERFLGADLAFAGHDHCVSGNMFWTRWSATGTDPTSGQSGSMTGIQIYRIENGRIVETWIATRPLGSSWPELATSAPASDTQ
jgi:hypothetical protein